MLPIRESLRLEGVTLHDRAVVRALWWADKSDWGDGPWRAEPDKVHWIDAATDLDCLAVRQGPHGHWCGYVGLPEGHPLYGLDYGELPSLEVHGGVNFSQPCREAEGDVTAALVELAGVCHTPEPGRPEHVFWLGFDCGHGWDFQPGEASLYRAIGLPEDLIRGLSEAIPGLRGRTYRDLEYVMRSCEHLAHQLRDLDRVRS